MKAAHSDALVFFGATGDLAYKKVFPALQAMLKRGHLDVPVIGVAKSGWDVEQLKARSKESLEKHGGLDPAAFEKLSGLLRYVDGDYNNPATFQAIRQTLGSAQQPAFSWLPKRARRCGRLEDGNLCGIQAGDQFMALARRSLLLPRRQMSARDLHGSYRPIASTADNV